MRRPLALDICSDQWNELIQAHGQQVLEGTESSLWVLSRPAYDFACEGVNSNTVQGSVRVAGVRGTMAVTIFDLVRGPAIGGHVGSKS